MIDEEIRKVRPNKEIAKSIFKMIKIRLEELETKDRMKFPSLVVEDYYEIIKEAITALMAIEGYKTLSHKALVSYLREFFPQFSYPVKNQNFTSNASGWVNRKESLELLLILWMNAGVELNVKKFNLI